MNTSQALPMESPFEQMEPELAGDFNALVNVGHLTDEFTFCGRHFVIRTLKPNEELAAAIAVKAYRETLKEPEAWCNAQIGLALMAVDHDDAFCPPTNHKLEDFARARLHWVGDEFYQPVLNYVWNRYVELLARQKRAVEEADSLSQRNLHIWQPFADSSTEPGTSDAETDSEGPTSTPWSSDSSGSSST